MLMDEDTSKKTQATQHVPQAVKDAVLVQSARLPPYTPVVKGIFNSLYNNSFHRRSDKLDVKFVICLSSYIFKDTIGTKESIMRTYSSLLSDADCKLPILD